MKRKINVIYASASGNTLLVAKYIKDRFLDEMFDAKLHRAELFETSLFKEKEVYIFAISTWEHGVPNPHFDDLLDHFKNNKNKLKVAFIGLGDLRYEPVLFCGGMNSFREAMINGGGNELISPLRLNGEPHDKLNNVVENWFINLLEKIKNEK